MNVRTIRDKRSESYFENLFNKMVRDAGLSDRQKVIVMRYLQAIFRLPLRMRRKSLRILKRLRGMRNE